MSTIGRVVENRKPWIISGIVYPEAVGEGAEARLKTALAEKLSRDEQACRISLTALVLDWQDPEQAMAAENILLARITSRDLDFIITEQANFAAQMDRDDESVCLFLDLRTLLPEELLARLEREGRIVSLETSFAGDYPYLIDVEDTPLAELLGIRGANRWLGILVNTQRRDACAALIEMIP